MGDQENRRPSLSSDKSVSQCASNKCGTCEKNLTKRSEFLQCEYCGKFFHKDCQNVSTEFYSLIKQFGSVAGGSCHWFCDVCNPKAIDVLKLVQQVKDKNNELDNRLLSGGESGEDG
jgi:hypothetical protein